MPEEPTDAHLAEELAQEEAIVEEAIAALQHRPTDATDHVRDRRRVRATIAAIEAAR